jgi:hypothetical protein
MDFFDAYRDKTRPKLEKPWTSVSVTLERGETEPTIEFGYEVLDLTDRSP